MPHPMSEDADVPPLSSQGMKPRKFEHGSHDPQTDVTHDDPIITGKIALAHLKEFPDYYERLERMESEAERDWAGKLPPD